MSSPHPHTTTATATAPTRDNGLSVTARRVVAYLVDWTVYALIVGWVFVDLATQTEIGSASTSGVELRLDLGRSSYYLTGMDGLLFLLGAFLFWCLSRAVLHALFGRTVGKALTAITVVDGHGRRPSFTRALVRELAWPVDGFPYVIPGLVGYLTIRGCAERRRLGDRLAGTYVTRRSAGR